MMLPDVTQILDSIHAIAADESGPAQERLEAVMKIADAAEEHEDKLNLSIDAP